LFGFVSLLLALQASPDPAAPASPVSPAQFTAWFQSARTGELAIPPEVSQAAQQYRYVFIRGFQTAQTPGYFARNAKELLAQGIPPKAVHVIEPSSDETPASNAGLVRAGFLEIAGQGPEKLVVIAHSRGACDTLAFALDNPEFVSNHVEALFLIQGPFGGSAIADYIMGDGPPLDCRIPWPQRLIATVATRRERFRLERGRHRGIPDLTRSASHEFWQRTIQEREAAIAIVGPKTFYVTSRISAPPLRPSLRASTTYLSTHFGPNDGVVALCDQALRGVGTVLAVLDATHSDLTISIPASRSKRRMQKALIDAIIMTVGESVCIP
jgi:hypothetical protein